MAKIDNEILIQPDLPQSLQFDFHHNDTQSWRDISSQLAPDELALHEMLVEIASEKRPLTGPPECFFG